MNDTTKEPSTAVATTVAPQANIREVLQDLQSSVLAETAEGQRLIQRVENALAVLNDRSSLGASQITNWQAMQAYIRFGEFVAKGNATIPDHLKGNAADCTAIAMRADRWGLDFFGVAEKTHNVKGKLGYEGQLVGAILKNMGAIKEQFHDEYFGDWTKINGKSRELESKTQKDTHGQPVKYRVPAWEPSDEKGLGIRIWTTLAGETQPRYLEVLMTQALVRNSTLWASNPQQQLFYLAEKMWARKYCPEALLGVYTPDELEQFQAPRNMGNAQEVRPDSAGVLSDQQLAAWEAEAAKGCEAAAAYWKAAGKEFRARATEDDKKRMWSIAEKADRERTVDVADTKPTAGETKSATGETKPPASEPAPAAAETAAPTEGAASAAETDRGTADFVAAMDAAERENGGAK